MPPTVSQLAARAYERIANDFPSVGASMFGVRQYVESIIRGAITEGQRVALDEAKREKEKILPFPPEYGGDAA